jgi:type IV pilus assembly protein PilA
MYQLHIKKIEKGFTLIEILLVIAAISILAAIVIVAINPAKQLGNARDAQRRADVNTILNAVWQEAIDSTTGAINAAVPTTTKEICLGGTTGTACTDAPATGISGADLSYLITNEKYLVSIPFDPKKTLVTGSCSTTGTCYTIIKSANGRVTVAATSNEQAVTALATQSVAGATTVTVGTAGSGYNAVPSVTITNGTCTGTGVGPATISGGAVTAITTSGLTCAAGQTFTVTVTSPIFVSR